MLVILYYLFSAKLSHKFVNAELMGCIDLSGKYCCRKASNRYVLQQQPHII